MSNKKNQAAQAPKHFKSSSAESATAEKTRMAAPAVPAAPGKPDAPEASAPRKHRGRRIAAAIVIILVVLLAGTYAAGSAYFSDHFLPNTTVNGIDVSLKTADDLKNELDEQIDAFSTNVSNADGSFSLDIPGENITLESDTASTAQEAAASLAGTDWPRRILEPTALTIAQTATFDQSQLDEIVKAAVDDFNQTATQPQGSHVAYDEASSSFVASDASYGTALDAAKVSEAASTGVSGLEQAVTLTDDALLAPTETQSSDDVIAAAGAANKLISGDIPLTVNGKQAAKLSQSDMASWITVDDDMKLRLDTDAVTKWVDDVLSPAVDYSDDQYDWKVSTKKMVAAISDAVEKGSNDPIKIPMYRELKVPDETDGAAQLGRHIDVNLQTQYARMYDDSGNVIWESFIVSGNTSQGRGTPTGTFQINSGMGTNITLVGADENHDGEPDYKSPVKYWMPFVGNSVGLHDAPWRSNFGGSIYTYNGSHGCVNLPSDKAAQLYSLVKVGDTVIVHN